MSKDVYDRLAAGIQEAIAYAEGTADVSRYGVHIPATVDLKQIRRRLGLSQPAFARRFGFSLGRIRDWEQGRTEIDASSRVLLTVIEREPEAVERALSARAA